MSASGGAAVSNVAATTGGASGYAYNFSNKTGDNLLFVYGGQVGNTSKATDKVAFSNGDKIHAASYNAPNGSAGGFTLYEDGGYGSTYSFNAGGGSNPCALTGQPTMGLGAIANVTFTDQTFGYAGKFSWPDGSSCTFEMLTAFQNWVSDHPFWSVVIGIAAVVAVVAVTYFTGGADLEALTTLGEGELEGEQFLTAFDIDNEFAEQTTDIYSSFMIDD